jgi:Fe(II)/alpha-ketoglutarate-dependent arginine beta-hydroxylase
MITTCPSTVAVFELTGPHRATLDVLLEELERGYPLPDDPRFLREARRIAFTRLPDELIGFLDLFHRTESTGAVVVEGFEIDDSSIGSTPQYWNAQVDARLTFREEAYLILLGSLLGEAFGWSTLQRGHVVHNILPIRDHEEDQSGHGSLARLAWHTEDGFHPYRCDYLGLISLRNDDRIATTIATVDAVRLPSHVLRTLAEHRYSIRPDDEHILQRVRDGTDSAESRLPGDWSQPPPTSVLFGDPRSPYLRIDPVYMSTAEGDDAAADALAQIVDQLEQALVDVVLAPGSVCFIDNFRAVHGRQRFVPRYDGRDRWLKKINITRDLRKSRDARGEVDGRVVQPIPLHDPDAPVRRQVGVEP